jgi:hypothetical protein
MQTTTAAQLTRRYILLSLEVLIEVENPPTGATPSILVRSSKPDRALDTRSNPRNIRDGVISGLVSWSDFEDLPPWGLPPRRVRASERLQHSGFITVKTTERARGTGDECTNQK